MRSQTYCSLKKPLSLHAVLWKSVLSWIHLFLYPLLFTSLISLPICKASSDNHFAFLFFFFFLIYHNKLNTKKLKKSRQSVLYRHRKSIWENIKSISNFKNLSKLVIERNCIHLKKETTNYTISPQSSGPTEFLLSTFLFRFQLVCWYKNKIL